MEEAERRGQLTEGTQAILARFSTAAGIGVQQRAGLLDFPTGPLRATQVGTQALQPFQFDRSLQFAANQQSARNRAGLLSGGGQLLGQLGGIALFQGLAPGGFLAGAAAVPSAPKYKKDT